MLCPRHIRTASKQEYLETLSIQELDGIDATSDTPNQSKAKVVYPIQCIVVIRMIYYFEFAQITVMIGCESSKKTRCVRIQSL
jgi:hypothetical protein